MTTIIEKKLKAAKVFHGVLCLERSERNGYKHETTVGNTEIFLEWWCYFTLLDRSGIHEVEISLPGLETANACDGENAEGAGKVLTIAIAAYMEKRADEFGALFSRARAGFDYEGLKNTYRDCFLFD